MNPPRKTFESTQRLSDLNPQAVDALRTLYANDTAQPIHVAQIPEGFVCKGSVWADLEVLMRFYRETFPLAQFNVVVADEPTAAYWRSALADGKAELHH